MMSQAQTCNTQQSLARLQPYVLDVVHMSIILDALSHLFKHVHIDLIHKIDDVCRLYTITSVQ